MRAAMFHGARDIRVEEVGEPPQLGPFDVAVVPRWCGICGTDVYEYLHGPAAVPTQPHPLTGAQLPHPLGHEFAGEVVAAGSNVTAVTANDRVAVMPLLTCGRCPPCRRGQFHLCDLLAVTGLNTGWGGLSDLVVVHESQAARLPLDVDDASGALVEPAAVAAAACDRADIRPGETVLVAGGGPIGSLVALYAAGVCSAIVYVSEPNPGRRAWLESSLPVAGVLDPVAGDASSWLTGTLVAGVDVALECAGREAALRTCLAATRRGGRVVQVGLHHGPATIAPFDITRKALTVTGSWGYPVDDWPRIIGLISSGRLPVERVVTARIPLDEVVPRGFEVLADPDGTELKVLVDLRG